MFIYVCPISDGVIDILRTYECKFCSQLFETSDDLKNHEDIILTDKTSCTKCQREFPNHNCLTYHTQTVHITVNEAVPLLYNCMKCNDLLNNELVFCNLSL